MNIAIIGGGGGASNAANVIRKLDKDARIDIFTNRGEIGNLPCEIPFVLKGTLPSWESSFAFRDKFYKERNIQVHLNTEVTELIRADKRLVAGGETYEYDKAILDLGAIPSIPQISGIQSIHMLLTLFKVISMSHVMDMFCFLNFTIQVGDSI